MLAINVADQRKPNLMVRNYNLLLLVHEYSSHINSPHLMLIHPGVSALPKNLITSVLIMLRKQSQP